MRNIPAIFYKYIKYEYVYENADRFELYLNQQ